MMMALLPSSVPKERKEEVQGESTRSKGGVCMWAGGGGAVSVEGSLSIFPGERQGGRS